jgi:hypothetical protein
LSSVHSSSPVIHCLTSLLECQRHFKLKIKTKTKVTLMVNGSLSRVSEGKRK